MTTFSRPGVFVQEVALPDTVTPGDVGTAIGAFVGALAKGPTAAPVLLTSWTQFTKIFGALNDTYPTTWAAYNFFANGGRQLYVKRIAGASAVAASLALTDRASAPQSTILVSASNPGTWGNFLAVEVKNAGTANRFNLLVYNDGGVIEQFADLSMDSEDPRYAIPFINSQSAYITTEDLLSPSTALDKMPAIAGLQILSGGVNGSAPTRTEYAAALESFDAVQNPLIFNIPAAAYIYSPSGTGTERSLAVNITGDLINYCELRGDAFAVIDVPRSQTVSDAQDFVADALAAAPDSDGGIAAAYYPWLVIPDTLRASGAATRLQAPGAAMIGQYLATDASRGVFKTPAGLTNRLALAVATETQLTNSNLDDLNDNVTPINVIRQVAGAGIVAMGGRTLHNTSGERYINKQRSMIYIKKELENRSMFAVFENNDVLLWKKLQTALSSFLTSYWQQGGLRGNSTQQAYYVKVDSTTTSFTDIQNGRVNIEVGVALQYPAEFVVIKLGQLTGNASA